MISRAERLPVRGERRRPANISRGKYFAVKTFPPGAARARFAVIIGKAVFRAATKRNRLKRMSLRTMKAARGHKPPVDVLAIALPSAGRIPEGEAVRELQEIISRIP